MRLLAFSPLRLLAFACICLRLFAFARICLRPPLLRPPLRDTETIDVWAEAWSLALEKLAHVCRHHLEQIYFIPLFVLESYVQQSLQETLQHKVPGGMNECKVRISAVRPQTTRLLWLQFALFPPGAVWELITVMRSFFPHRILSFLIYRI